MLHITHVAEELASGLKAITALFPERFTPNGQALSLDIDTTLAPGANRVSVEGTSLRIAGGSRLGAFRALGRVMGTLCTGGKVTPSEEAPAFEMVGIMLDCSRNAVMKPEKVYEYATRCALMGINTIMLYTEETYEIPDEPFFGYLRGGYSKSDLKQLDDFADALGIEMFPCIQTLGHMEEFLQWPPAHHLRDNESVLCARDEQVYALIEKCIAASAECFRSKRIHIGMDEAHGIAQGKFKERFGEVPPFQVMNEHLARVQEICRAKGLSPMIWSDMYFRLGSKTHDYYDLKWEISDEIIAGIPKDVALVYWDYYHIEQSDYETFIDFHRKLGKEPIFAGGIWTWDRFWCGQDYSIRATDAAMNACRAKGLKEAFVTLWGDDGTECSYESALPAIQHFAECAYAASVAPEMRATHFMGSCGAEWAAFDIAAHMDANEFFHDRKDVPAMISKGILWQDPFLSLIEPFTAGKPMEAFYEKLSAQLYEAASKGGFQAKLAFPALLSETVALKVNLRTHMAKALADNDRDAMRDLRDRRLIPLCQKIEALWKMHREVWMTLNRPFGWEVIENRYGGLMARHTTALDRITQWCDGTLDNIPELSAPLLNPWEKTVPEGCFPHMRHVWLKTPSTIR